MRIIVLFLAFFVSKNCFADSTYLRIHAKVLSIKSYLPFNLILVKDTSNNKTYRIFSKKEIEQKIKDTTSNVQNDYTLLKEGEIHAFCIKMEAVEIEPNVKIFTSDRFDIKYGPETILPQNEAPYISPNIKGLRYKYDDTCGD